MSPIMLTILIASAKEDGHLGGRISHLVDECVFILHYAGDTTIFMEHDLDKSG